MQKMMVQENAKYFTTVTQFLLVHMSEEYELASQSLMTGSKIWYG